MQGNRSKPHPKHEQASYQFPMGELENNGMISIMKRGGQCADKRGHCGLSSDPEKPLKQDTPYALTVLRFTMMLWTIRREQSQGLTMS